MITSLQNPLVKQVRKLHRSKGRREQGLSLLEGTHSVETACQVNCSFTALCFTEDWQERHSQLGERASQLAERVERVTPEVLQSLATTVHPDGVVATLRRGSGRVPSPTSLQLGLALERLQDPGNLGTIVRTAVAAGADGLWLSPGSVDADNPKVLRSSAGAWFYLPMAVESDLPQAIAACREQGVRAIATLPAAPKTYWEVDLTQPILLLLGNEGAGLSGPLVSLADDQVRVPVEPGVESLNVGIAAALLLYEAKRQRRQEAGPMKKFSPPEMKEVSFPTPYTPHPTPSFNRD